MTPRTTWSLSSSTTGAGGPLGRAGGPAPVAFIGGGGGNGNAANPAAAGPFGAGGRVIGPNGAAVVAVRRGPGPLPVHFAPHPQHQQQQQQQFYQQQQQQFYRGGQMQQQPFHHHHHHNQHNHHQQHRYNNNNFQRPPQPGSILPRQIDGDLGIDPRPVLLFDLNGTVASGSASDAVAAPVATPAGGPAGGGWLGTGRDGPVAGAAGSTWVAQ